MPDGVTLPSTMHDNFLARWRIRRSKLDYRLVLEGLVIPPSHDKLPAMTGPARDLLEGPGAPVVVLATSPKLHWVQVMRWGTLKGNPLSYLMFSAGRGGNQGHRPLRHPLVGHQTGPLLPGRQHPHRRLSEKVRQTKVTPKHPITNAVTTGSFTISSTRQDGASTSATSPATWICGREGLRRSKKLRTEPLCCPHLQTSVFAKT